MSRLPLLPCLALPLTLAACGSAEEPVPFDDGRAGVSAGEGARRGPYPDPPYGTKVGAVIPNQEWLGWMDPAQASYDVEALERISLAEFYDPDGTQGIEYIVLTSTAVWCQVCRLEYEDFASGRVDTWEERGVVFMGALFEDNDANPARPAHLGTWAEAYDVTFPFVLDPGFKLGAFFSREATPMTMIIDASTMEILWLEEGWSLEGSGQSLWDVLGELP